MPDTRAYRCGTDAFTPHHGAQGVPKARGSLTNLISSSDRLTASPIFDLHPPHPVRVRLSTRLVRRVHRRLTIRQNALRLSHALLAHVDPDSAIGFLCERRQKPGAVGKPLLNGVSGCVSTPMHDTSWDGRAADVTDSLVFPHHQGRFQPEPAIRSSRIVASEVG